MIRIFIGASPNGADAECQAVLEWSLRKHASEPLEITWMVLSRDRNSPFYSEGAKGWQTANWPTPFSAFRWAVPGLCNFEGRAIYLDCDMIALDDIAKLWHQEFQPGKIVIGHAASRLCCSLWNCEAAKPYIISDEKLHAAPGHVHMRSIMLKTPTLVQQFPEGENWNCLDGEKYETLKDPEIRIIHMTSMPHQPHLVRANERLGKRGTKHWFDGKITKHWRIELTQLFNDLLAEAEANGFLVSNYDHVDSFGTYKKSNLRGLVGKVPSWGKV
jgi:hypothetical protein